MNDVRVKATMFRPNMFIGDHEFKTGFSNTHTDFGRWYPISEDLPLPNYRLRFQNSAPIELEVPNYPNNPKVVHQYTGVFIQDRWTVARRLTLNLGIRHAHDHGYAAAACREAALPPAHLAFPAQCFPEVGYPVLKPWDPRINAAFDLTGDGKTVVKAGWSAFSHQNFVEDMIPLDAGTPGTARYRWRDLNGNRDYDAGEVNLDPRGTDFITQSIIARRAESGPDRAVDERVHGLGRAPADAEPGGQGPRPLLEQHQQLPAGRTSCGRTSAYNIPITRPDPGPDASARHGRRSGREHHLLRVLRRSLVGQAFERTDVHQRPADRSDVQELRGRASTRTTRGGWQLSASHTATKKHVPFFVGNMITEIDAADRRARATTPTRKSTRTDIDLGMEQQDLGLLSSSRTASDSAPTTRSGAGVPFARTHLFSGGQTIPSIVLNAEPFGTRQPAQHPPRGPSRRKDVQSRDGTEADHPGQPLQRPECEHGDQPEHAVRRDVPAAERDYPAADRGAERIVQLLGAWR